MKKIGYFCHRQLVAEWLTKNGFLLRNSYDIIQHGRKENESKRDVIKKLLLQNTILMLILELFINPKMFPFL